MEKILHIRTRLFVRFALFLGSKFLVHCYLCLVFVQFMEFYFDIKLTDSFSVKIAQVEITMNEKEITT
ncbi:hypothetical protein P781_03825 [Vibrio mimicus CAIM 1883]|nr:hypothetical protein D908_19445 [Vibrio mimicus CAIM 602]ERM62133.1 hypothetical protein P781_03825 [Vibrio mimicus CAIM 1883]ERM62537.1 hypothetical protein P780_03795 [Vibrio mimicus CAIM 1882]